MTMRTTSHLATKNDDSVGEKLQVVFHQSCRCVSLGAQSILVVEESWASARGKSAEDSGDRGGEVGCRVGIHSDGSFTNRRKF